jgi:hypothetical protein
MAALGTLAIKHYSYLVHLANLQNLEAPSPQIGCRRGGILEGADPYLNQATFLHQHHRIASLLHGFYSCLGALSIAESSNLKVTTSSGRDFGGGCGSRNPTYLGLILTEGAGNGTGPILAVVGAYPDPGKVTSSLEAHRIPLPP